MKNVNKAEVKFLWQISGPSATVAYLGNYILGYRHDIHIEDCICDQFPDEISIKEGQFYEKNWPSHVLGPHIAGHLGKMGFSQLYPNRPTLKFLNNYLYKIQV